MSETAPARFADSQSSGSANPSPQIFECNAYSTTRGGEMMHCSNFQGLCELSKYRQRTE